MLRLLSSCLSACSALALAAPLDDGIRQPVQLTVGAADQLLGQLSPDSKALYFVSNAEASTDIYVQDLADGRQHRLFDEGADVTWPRVSPDGAHLLYISFGHQATGQLCVRDLPGGEGRRCLESSGAVQAEWVSPSRIALVSRATMQSDFHTLGVAVGRQLSSTPLFEGDLTSPTVSPDGRWLVYVPVQRDVKQVGPGFAAHTTRRLAAVRLDQPGFKRQDLEVDLPGETAQPAFSRDGRFLYFVQFLADSNRDGVVDAADHGVLFRVPFAPGVDDAPARVAQAWASQLTDASWNCQYPAPGQDRLVATCSQGENLDVYELPLDGLIPGDWSPARLNLEIELATRRVDQLLLYRRVLEAPAALSERRLSMVRMVRLHLAHDEFDAARFYAQKVDALPDPATEGLGRRLLLWVDHRQKTREREQGRDFGSFIPDERRRIAQLEPAPSDSPTAIAFGHVIASEIADSLGDKGEALRELRAAEVDARTARSVIELYFERADGLYRQLDEREALVQVCRRLATVPSLPADAQLLYARNWVRALTRGLPWTEADAVLAREQKENGGPEGAELRFAAELERAVLLIRDAESAGAREALVGLYRLQKRSDRQRALVADAVQRATQVDADGVVEALVQLYVEDVEPGTAERRRAEQLYGQVMLSRAFRDRFQGHLPQARAEFDQVVRHTRSLEALVGSLDLRLKAGERPEAVAADLQLAPGHPVSLEHFARAYLLTRKLEAPGALFDVPEVTQAQDQLRLSWAELQNDLMARAVAGALQHEAFLEAGDLTQAERASTQYQVALKLAKASPRESAMLLGELGLLHTEVNNHRIALSYLDQRAKLPAVDNTAGIAVRMARARALAHVGKEADAANAADQALVALGKEAKLSKYRVLVLDRAALSNLAAGRFERALALYDEELPLLEKDEGSTTERNRLVMHLARAAAALGAAHPDRALADLSEVARGLEVPGMEEALKWPHATPAEAMRTYRLITAGLEANALLRLGRTPEAVHALERREALFAVRLKELDRDEDLRATALVEDRLAGNAAATGQLPSAQRWAEAALSHADELARRTGAALTREQLDALWTAGQLGFGAEQLGQALDAMAAPQNVLWRRYAPWLEICLALEQAKATAAPPR